MSYTIFYTVVWPRLVWLALHPLMRDQFTLQWIECQLHQAALLHGQLLDYRKQVLLEMSWNCQTIVLERLLNYTFYNGNYDPNQLPRSAGRVVYIVNTADNLPLNYLYLEAEDVPHDYVYLLSEAKPRRYLYRMEDYLLAYDFLVYVPASDWNGWDDNTQARFKALINAYRAAGTRFKIITY